VALLITGTAGFVGYHLAAKLLAKGFTILGVDNLNDYYDVSLKEARNNKLSDFQNYTFYKADLADYEALEELFKGNDITHVINLAAQAGVRYSISNPYAYLHSNITGFMNVLELCRHYPVKHLIYASSSSVYGNNTVVPFSETDFVDNPVSLYAATKKSNELLAHSYSNLYKIATTGLRFFTVYGPYGRPDMAYFKFTKAISEGKSIDVYNNGDLKRDFTYIDDIVAGIESLIDYIPTGETPYSLYNIGNNNPVLLSDFIRILEECVGKEAEKNYLPMQKGDVYMTYANIDALQKATGYTPTTDIKTGLQKFVKWYKDYYGTL
jgi:UDP-glucuronate 4-epimerase